MYRGAVLILAGMLGGSLCAILARSTGATTAEKPPGGSPVPPPQACFVPPHDKLCSKLPHDITETFALGYSNLAARTQRAFDNFSWQSFVALNWPAGKDGNPLPRPIGSTPDAPRVWEFYKSPFDLFDRALAGENAPEDWAEGSTGEGAEDFTLLATRSNLPNLKPDSFLEASTNLPLLDRNLNFAVYDIAINPTEFAYIKSNNLNTKKGQEAFQEQGKQVSFPLGFYKDLARMTGGKVGAIEIKTAWRILDTTKGDKAERYFSLKGTIHIDAAHSESGRPMTVAATLGLVGFHVIQRTSGPVRFPQDWIWSTFEHVDNAPLAANAREATNINLPLPSAGTAPAKVDKTYSFFNPKYTGATNVPPPLPRGQKVYQWAAKLPYGAKYAFEGKYGTQVVRCWKVFPATQEVNAYFQKLLKGTVWQNYQLIGSQWMGGVEDPTVENGNIPRYLSNTTLETYLQFKPIGSCLGCHGYAQTTVKGQSANFSFLLMRAR